MKPITYRSYRPDGSIGERVGYPTNTLGLYVSPADKDPGYWKVAHVRGGGSFHWLFASPEAALALANALDGVADWTRPAEDLHHDAALVDAVAEAARAVGGCQSKPPFTKFRALDNGVPA